MYFAFLVESVTVRCLLLIAKALKKEKKPISWNIIFNVSFPINVKRSKNNHIELQPIKIQT
jgi:hypothetical protein